MNFGLFSGSISYNWTRVLFSLCSLTALSQKAKSLIRFEDTIESNLNPKITNASIGCHVESVIVGCHAAFAILEKGLCLSRFIYRHIN